MTETAKIAGTATESSLSAAVDEEGAGSRLDAWLTGALGALSRSRVKQLIKEGCVRRRAPGDMGPEADREPVTDPAATVRAGEIYAVSVPPPVPATPAAQPMALDILYEDESLVVLDKPPGLVVHPGPGTPDGTLVNALLAHCSGSLSGIGGVQRPGIVHRLDKDTSGVMVVAKSDAAHRELARQFSVHSIERLYTALVWGVPRPLVGEIEGNIGRHPTQRTKMAVVSDGGKAARTFYRVTRQYRDAVSLVACRLATGRTHQIRVHLAHRGHPVVGDAVYGRSRNLRGRYASSEAGEGLKAFPRQALHARELGFRHPASGENMKFEAKLPKDFERLIGLLDLL